MSDTDRIGIASGGNWIVDQVKTVDNLPNRGMLGNIKSEQLSTGGGPANALADLARMKVGFPLAGVGIVGDDEAGKYILNRFNELGVDVSNIATTTEAPTSYTDVMNEESTGDRVFFHCRGANALFGPDAIPVEKLTCRIFHLAYLLLLDAMDAEDAEYGTAAARALHKLQGAGIKTSLDLVSEESDRFKTIVPPALKYVDYLIMNEIEAGRVVGKDVRKGDDLDGAVLAEVVEELSGMGSMEIVAVHMPEGMYARDSAGNKYSVGSLQLPDGFVVSTVGAGDAFCAGMLYGLHEGWDYAKAGKLGCCCAAAGISAPGASDGVGELAEVLALGEKFPEKPPPVTV